MTTHTASLVEDWLLQHNGSTLQQYLQTLELWDSGSRFAQMDRLQKWILGNYCEYHFKDSEEPDKLAMRQRRLNIRVTFINSILQAHRQENDEQLGEETHPLASVANDERVKENLLRVLDPDELNATEEILSQNEELLARLAGERTDSPNSEATNQGRPNVDSETTTALDQNPQVTETNKDDRTNEHAQHTQRLQRHIQRLQEELEEQQQLNNRPQQQQQAPSGQTRNSQEPSRQQEQPGNAKGPQTVRITGTNNQEFEIPLDMARALAQMMVEVRDLKSKYEELAKPSAVSSTRIEGGPRNVNFRDTFTLYDNTAPANSTIDTSRPPPPTPEPRAKLPEQHPRDIHQEDETRRPNQTVAGTSNQSIALGLPLRDLGAIVLKWNLSFHGKRGENIETFLERLENARIRANMSKAELLPCLSIIFKDTAGHWYENEQANWVTYQDFLTAVRRWYGPRPGYMQKLVAEANARTQHPSERTIDYITRLRGVMLRMSPPWDLDQQLDLLYRNMLPKIKTNFRRSDFKTLETLHDLALEAEEAVEQERTYRPPPAPEQALIPELSYTPGKTTTPKETTVAATSYVPQKSTEANLLEQFSKLLEASLKKFREEQEHNNNRSSKPGSPNPKKKFNNRSPRRDSGHDRLRTTTPGHPVADPTGRASRKTSRNS